MDVCVGFSIVLEVFSATHHFYLEDLEYAIGQ